MKELVDRLAAAFPATDAGFASSFLSDTTPVEASLHAIRTEILHLTGWAETQGVSISIETDGLDHGSVFVSDLGRHDRNDPATKGAGARVLRRLFELMDPFAVAVEISVMRDEPDLVRHYASVGFVVDAGDRPDHGPIVGMRRPVPAPRH